MKKILVRVIFIDMLQLKEETLYQVYFKSISKLNEYVRKNLVMHRILTFFMKLMVASSSRESKTFSELTFQLRVIVLKNGVDNGKPLLYVNARGRGVTVFHEGECLDERKLFIVSIFSQGRANFGAVEYVHHSFIEFFDDRYEHLFVWFLSEARIRIPHHCPVQISVCFIIIPFKADHDSRIDRKEGSNVTRS